MFDQIIITIQHIGTLPLCSSFFNSLKNMTQFCMKIDCLWPKINNLIVRSQARQQTAELTLYRTLKTHKIEHKYNTFTVQKNVPFDPNFSELERKTSCQHECQNHPNPSADLPTLTDFPCDTRIQALSHGLTETFSNLTDSRFTKLTVNLLIYKNNCEFEKKIRYIYKNFRKSTKFFRILEKFH